VLQPAAAFAPQPAVDNGSELNERRTLALAAGCLHQSGSTLPQSKMASSLAQFALLHIRLHSFSSPLMQLDRDKLQQSVDHNIRSHALTGGRKGRHDSMSQDRLGHSFDVIRCHMKSPLQQRIRSRAENQILTGSWTCTPRNQFLDKRWRFCFRRPRCPDQIASIYKDIVRARDSTNNVLQGPYLLGIQNGG
jgi:hypothetical protein